MLNHLHLPLNVSDDLILIQLGSIRCNSVNSDSTIYIILPINPIKKNGIQIK